MFRIVWPSDDNEVFGTYDDALVRARVLAKDHPEQTFTIVEEVAKVCFGLQVTETRQDVLELTTPADDNGEAVLLG